MDASGSNDTLTDLVASSIGRADFLKRHGLDSPEREERLAEISARIGEAGIEVVRFSFIDTHGQLRTRPLEARHFLQAARNGVPFTTALFAMDSANTIYQPVFSSDGGFGRASMGGAGDMLAIADPATFRVLPWAKNAASIFADLFLTDGEPCPFDPRRILRQACDVLARQGLAYVGGIEIECHIFKIVDQHLGLDDCTQPARPPSVAAYRHGYQYMSQLVLDDYEPVVDAIRRALLGLGLPLRTVECEWGPGQIEITLDPLIGIEAADAVMLMRTAVKQVAKRLGMIASFMTKPGLPNVYSAGWHLHESLVHDGSRGTGNAFLSDEAVISPAGRHFVGGLLEHAPACTAFSNPTINGYKRLHANPLAPKRAVWSVDNKAAMCRLVGGRGDRSTHIENRSGEPMANPYLFMASQILAGVDGMDRGREPGDPLADPYGQTAMPLLPASLMDAVDSLARSALFRSTLGDEFVDHFVGMKRFEIGRFLAAVTDWEHREYFEAF